MAAFLSKPQSQFKTELSTSLPAADGVIRLAADVVEDVGYLIIEPGTSNQEIVKYTSKSTGLVSGGVRGLSTIGSSETAGTGKIHAAGSPVEMRNTHFYFARVIDALNGVSATSANSFIIGEANGTISAQGNTFFMGRTSGGNQFRIGLSTNGFGVWSDDQGVTYNRLSATGGAINTGDGWQNVGGTGSVVVDDLISATGGISSNNNNFVVNEAWSPTWTGNHRWNGSLNKEGTFLSASFADINQVVSGSSAYSGVTAYGLNSLVDGTTLSAGSSKHFHLNSIIVSSRSAGSTGTQQILTNSMVSAKNIVIQAYVGNGSSHNAWSTGYGSPPNVENCIYLGANGVAGLQPNNIIHFRDSVGYNFVVATLSSMYDGNVILNWDTNTSAGGTRYFTCLFLG